MKFNEYYENLNPEIKEYFKIISSHFPKFLIPFIESKTLMRLKDVSYFCGAINASSKVYNFKYDISRLDHSISCALHVWNFTYNDFLTLAALFHDATAPALSHVVDYLNGDYLNQESTELNLEEYVKTYDPELFNYFKRIGINIKDISNFKDKSVVDLPRPCLCADRIDFVFLGNLAWSRNLTIDEIKIIYPHIITTINENGEEEFAFDDVYVADRVVELNDIVNNLTRQTDDYEEMNILSIIVKRLIDLKLISYEELYILTDKQIFDLIKSCDDKIIKELFYRYQNMEKDVTPTKANIKNRKLNPLVKNIRYTNF